MKRTIRIAALALALVLALGALAACGGETRDVDVAAVAADLTEKVEFPEMLNLTTDDVLNYIGVKPEDYSAFVARIPLGATSGDMIFLFRAASSEGKAAIAEKLERYRAQKLAEMNNYIPAEYDKIGAASVRTDGDIVWLVVSADQSAAEAAVLAHVR